MSIESHKLDPEIPTQLLDQRKQFLGFVQRRVADGALAEDILQTAYIRALQHGGELRANESAVAWFYRILRNAIIDHYRRRTTENKLLEAWGHALEHLPAKDPTLELVVCTCITAVLDHLTPAYAEILREVDLGNISLKDFATAHNITSGNAGVRAYRARLALRRELLRTCGCCAEHGCVDCTCRPA
ncbi:RNA polymerase sigma factor [Terriglobus saanensis]|uniref:RNA polymerase sigma factor n=1 Tax=Terriglobus saanensis (strain ATCC BAA-1853 / DSM 23119 / SP1PR4) TaxID=401053 RepID=E8V6E5_TERSS|nr:sigma-70 family RNA polymerase sigma factor [Terriglobus saanensis]ADV81610.1 RNA polymerase, sigma-24 subunit, ECF subfamily [Terriglobus saanensis SP1PR4]